MKSFIKKLLKKLNYSLVKLPTPDQDRQYDCLWKDWFSRYPELLIRAYTENKAVLSPIDSWIDMETINHSLWQYGIPREVDLEQVNSFDYNISYSELILFLGSLVKNAVYLELGVSAGKNFYQIASNLNNATIYGLDIETINARLEKLLPIKSIVWESPTEVNFTNYKGENTAIRFSLKELEHPAENNNNTLYYLQADKFSPHCWEQLMGNRFSLVFSDACHLPESLDSEIDFLLQYDLLDEGQFIMIWDDLEEELVPAFHRSIEKLRNYFSGKPCRSGLYRIQGTYGNTGDSGAHSIGIFSCLP